MKNISQLFKVLSASLVCGVTLAGCTAERKSSDSLNIWYGPGSINTVDRTLRSDFIEQVTNTENWPTVYNNTVVFKQFIETMYPKKGFYSDEQLKKMADFVNKAGLKTAFEVGALRWTPRNYGPGSAERHARREIQVLQRWVKAGGKIDYLTTDHAVMWNVGRVLQGSKPMAKYENSDWRYVMGEVVKSLDLIHKAFPEAKIGIIESLGYFSVVGIDGKKLETTDPLCIYPIDYKEFIVTFRDKLKKVGITLDHIHVDFSYQDCKFDGGETKTLDFNRILGAEKVVKDLGISSGIIINAFDDPSYLAVTSQTKIEKPKNVAVLTRSAIKNSKEYLQGYLKAGGNPDLWIFQRWMPYPDVTGPETVPETDMGLTKLLLEQLQGD